MAAGPGRQPRPAEYHPAPHRPGDPSPVSEGRRRHYRDQQLQREPHRHGRLWHGRAGYRAQPRRGADRPRRGGRVLDPGPTRIRGRRAGPHQRRLLHLAEGRGPGVSRPGLRRTGGCLSGGRPRPDRGWRGPPADRDRVRHPERQGGHLRLPTTVRRGRPGAAPDDLRHHHRPVRSHPLRADHRGLLQQPPPCRAPLPRAQLRPGAGPTAPACGGTLTGGRMPRQRAPERRPAQ